jgi:hypothetical protein
MPRTPRLALLWLAASAMLLVVSLPAQAVPIHRHVWSKKPLPDGVHQPLLLRVVKLDVSPPYVPPKPEPIASSSPAVVASAPVATSVPVAPASTGLTAPVDPNCESGGDPTTNTGNGYYGAYQFDSQTWDAYGDPAYGEASDAPMSVQTAAANSVPYDAWPNC